MLCYTLVRLLEGPKLLSMLKQLIVRLQSKVLSKDVQPDGTTMSHPNHPACSKEMEIVLQTVKQPLASSSRSSAQVGKTKTDLNSKNIKAKAQQNKSNYDKASMVKAKFPEEAIKDDFGKQQAPKSLNAKSSTTASTTANVKKDEPKRVAATIRGMTAIKTGINGKLSAHQASEQMKEDRSADQGNKRRVVVEKLETKLKPEKKHRSQETAGNKAEGKAPLVRKAPQNDEKKEWPSPRTSTNPIVPFQPPKTIDEIRKEKQQKLNATKSIPDIEKGSQVASLKAPVDQPKQPEIKDKEEASKPLEDNGLLMEDSLVDIDVGDIGEDDFDDFEAQMKALEDAL